MKKFILLFAMLFSINAFALDVRAVDSAGFDKLTEEQKAEVIQTVASEATRQATNASTLTPPTAEKMEEWVTLGQKLGEAMVGAAKEIGIATNEFVKTPVGKMITVLIVWHFMGSAILHILLGIVIMTIGLIVTRKFYNIFSEVQYIYDTEKTDIFKRYRLKEVKRESLHDGQVLVLVIMTVASMGFGSLAILTST